MKKSTLFILSSIVLLAIVMRLKPLLEFPLWGSDSPEYFALTQSLLLNGLLIENYSGWGFGYPYFPGMFLLDGALSVTTGIDVLTIQTLVIPTLGALTVIPVFLIGRRMFEDDRIGLLASLVVAVIMPHVYTTSHPMPGALGDLFFTTGLIVFLKIRHSTLYALHATLFMLLAMALAVIHHLSFYFLFLACTFGRFYQEFVKHRPSWSLPVKIQWGLCFYLLGLVIYFWFIRAPVFRDKIIKMAFDIPLILLIIAPFFGLLFLLLLLKLRPHWKFTYPYRIPNIRKLGYRFLILILLLALLALILIFTGVPASNIPVQSNVLLFFLPFILLLAFASVGSALIDFANDGLMLYGFILGIGLSLVLALATNNVVIIPFRHIQYLMIPVALLIALGIVRLSTGLKYISRKLRTTLHIFVTVLIVGNSLIVYPPQTIIAGFQEGLTNDDLTGVFWAKGSLNENSVFATDHRLSSALFGFGNMYATWDTTPVTFHSENLTVTLDELCSVNAPHEKRTVNYVMLDNVMKNGVALNPLDHAKPMDYNVLTKFESGSFIKMFDNGNVQVYYTAFPCRLR